MGGSGGQQGEIGTIGTYGRELVPSAGPVAG